MSGLIRESARRLFANLDLRDLASAAESGQWSADVWARIEVSGFLQVAAQIGEEVELDDVFDVAREVGAAAIALPVTETIIAHAAASRLGLHLAPGPAALVWFENGIASRVPFGRHLSSIVGIRRVDGNVVWELLSCDQVVSNNSSNYAGEPRDTLVLRASRVPWKLAPVDLDFEDWGAALLCAQIAGAAATVVSMSSQYARDRVQFGKPIARFQAVQHLLARMGAESAAADASAELASIGLAGKQSLLVSAAKARASESAGIITAIAHQVHGAMGLALEHDLPIWGRRLLSWRDEHGSEHALNQRVGEALLKASSADLWEGMTNL